MTKKIILSCFILLFIFACSTIKTNYPIPLPDGSTLFYFEYKHTGFMILPSFMCVDRIIYNPKTNKTTFIKGDSVQIDGKMPSLPTALIF